MSDLLHVSASPHSRSSITTRDIMRDVLIALLPASIFGIYNFGLRALLVILVTITASVMTEYLYCRLMKKPVYRGDYSDIVTGLLLALNLPSSIPLWIAVMGGVFAILVVKMLYGGLGQNFMNPALAARVFLLISFPVRMTTFAVEKIASPTMTDYLRNGAVTLDGVSSATPLAAIKAGETVDVLKLFIGTIGGTIGETSAVAIIVGAGYLVLRRIISLRIPLTYIISFAMFVVLFGGKGMDTNFIFGQLLGGGLMLGAFFMATDYVTSPGTPKGQIIYGILLGLLTGLFRLFGGSAEGVSYAIIFGNLLVPIIEKYTVPKAFGKERVRSGR
ncbi:RnfABCDGE type electron transport complex subunit D [Mobilitalea sibirica]|uniref:Ion-translocating oxidoreductase complex subunit D n=1 Tax=Mobilitalea sibirica TaxID=1462919 RepID=A0A8J7HCP9_9FIRM|nr:RnfABCDGE type electron transport complex subunit D [Mobilitalea sibirica]MBH1941182.1 RnfABCDGE type electron transport complex subunit D [Mobilitalea sibirica]